MASDLEPYAAARDATSGIDEHRRAAALRDLRGDNFERILRLLSRLGVAGGRLLDVGCGHGWFLEAASGAGFRVAGIEPDAVIQQQAARCGATVWHGFFPADIPAGEAFDVIVFNDVLEHLPNVADMIRVCGSLLRAGGLLVVNVPSSEGFFYRLADSLDRCGWSGPFERLWQKHFPSPHLSYFNPGALERLARRHGFREEARERIPAVRVRGLWQRLRYDRSSTPVAAALHYVGLVPLVTLAEALPADTVVQVFRRIDASASSAEAEAP